MQAAPRERHGHDGNGALGEGLLLLSRSFPIAADVNPYAAALPSRPTGISLRREAMRIHLNRNSH